MADKDDDIKNKGGRPPKFETPEEMQAVIDAYFAECDPHIVESQYVEKLKNGQYKVKTIKRVSNPVPYTMSGLAFALGMSRQALLDYKKKDKFLDTIKNARAQIERSVEEGMLSSNGVVAGHIFNLKNNFGWQDRHEIDHTSKGKSIAPKIVSEITPRVAAETPAAPSHPADQ